MSLDRITTFAVCWPDGRWSTFGEGFKCSGRARGGLIGAHVRAGSEALHRDPGGNMRSWAMGAFGCDGEDRGHPCA